MDKRGVANEYKKQLGVKCYLEVVILLSCRAPGLMPVVITQWIYAVAASMAYNVKKRKEFNSELGLKTFAWNLRIRRRG